MFTGSGKAGEGLLGVPVLRSLVAGLTDDPRDICAKKACRLSFKSSKEADFFNFSMFRFKAGLMAILSVAYKIPLWHKLVHM